MLQETNECFRRHMSASGDEEVLRETNECFGRRMSASGDE